MSINDTVYDYLQLVKSQNPQQNYYPSSYYAPAYHSSHFWYFPIFSSSDSSSSSDSISKNSAAFWIGSILFLGSIAWLGSLWKKAQDQHSELHLTKEVLRIVHDRSNSIGSLRTSLTALVKKHLPIQAYLYSKNRNYLVCAVSLAGSGLSLVLGGLLSASFLLTISTISAIASIALLLFTLSYHWNDNSNPLLLAKQRECASIASRIEKAMIIPLWPYPRISARISG